MPPSPFDLIFPSDLTRIPKQMLRELSIDAGLPSDGPVTELAINLWAKVAETSEGRRTYLHNALPSIFAGRTSILWLILDPIIDGLANARVLEKRFGFNPYEKLCIPKPEEIGTTPRLIGITPFDKDKEQFLARFVVKTRIGRRVAGYGIATDETVGLISVLVDVREGFIEIRGDRRASNQTVRAVQQLLPDGVRVSRVQILGPFDDSIERLADALDGKLIEAISRPDALVENLTEDQLNAVISILSCISEYLVVGDTTVLETTLETARETLAAADQDFVSMPFMAVILAGMQKLNLAAVDQDLRMQPLYSFLGPVLQHQGCYIRFPVEDEEGTEYTIRVGIQTNTISFHTPASEAAIAKVRRVILGNYGR